MDIPRFTPYDHQVEFLQAMGSGCTRAFNVWHRRSGKDHSAFLGWMVPEALRKTGLYYYFFPTYAQGKKIIWDGIDSSGVPILHYVAGALGLDWRAAQKVLSFNETELQIRFPSIKGGSNGSIIQIIGMDNLDRIVGTNPRGVIYSEYALQKPQVWSFVRPILEANGGWAVFITTPRGNNHAFELWEEASKPGSGWYTSLKTILDTHRPDGSPIITMDQITKMRSEGEDEDIIQQEYFCSFAGAQSGSYYSNLVQIAREAGRLRPGLFDPNLPIDTFWDIGNGDDTVIGFRQTAHNERRWVDCYSNNKQGLEHYASVLTELARTKKYRYRHHYFPWDMAVKEYTTNEARIVAARRMGITPCSTVAKRPLYEGIDAVRRGFYRYWFDTQTCGRLITAITLYHKKWNKEGHVFSDQPDHDWTSHYADMVRYEAVTGDKYHRDEDHNFKTADSYFNPLHNEEAFTSDPFSDGEPAGTRKGTYY